MDINGISLGTAPKTGGGNGGGSVDAKISQLEQKLKQLGNEKDKAEKQKDEDKVQKLQKQMEQIRQQIDRLKQRESEKLQNGQAEEPLQEPDSSNISLPPSSVGQYVDESA